LGGGVTANQRLREKFQSVLRQNDKFNLFLPPLEYTTDNAMMIALAAFSTGKTVTSFSKEFLAESNC